MNVKERIEQLMANETQLKDIVKILKEEKFRNKNGAPYSKMSISKMQTEIRKMQAVEKNKAPEIVNQNLVKPKLSFHDIVAVIDDLRILQKAEAESLEDYELTQDDIDDLKGSALYISTNLSQDFGVIIKDLVCSKYIAQLLWNYLWQVSSNLQSILEYSS
jgi:1-deoxy-D-xylulose 5-phosphate reductoisomerase